MKQWHPLVRSTRRNSMQDCAVEHTPRSSSGKLRWKCRRHPIAYSAGRDALRGISALLLQVPLKKLEERSAHKMANPTLCLFQTTSADQVNFFFFPLRVPVFCPFDRLVSHFWLNSNSWSETFTVPARRSPVANCSNTVGCGGLKCQANTDNKPGA